MNNYFHLDYNDYVRIRDFFSFESQNLCKQHTRISKRIGFKERTPTLQIREVVLLMFCSCLELQLAVVGEDGRIIVGIRLLSSTKGKSVV